MADWGWLGDVSDVDAERVLHAAIENGINFIDTADVYGDGRSERFIAKVLSETKEEGVAGYESRTSPAAARGRRLQSGKSHGFR